MTVDNILYPEANHLAHAEKSFYPLRIPVSHWQLRHYISHQEPNTLYYASGHDIYCLNAAAKKRRHIATLPFEARCTASGYGWVCVGGEEDGHFAAIKLDGSGPRTLDVDSALPIENLRNNGGRRAASVKLERMGEDIVNSISIHRIQDEEAHLDDIVAVLTNNDKTVRMYSLPQNLETMVLDLPFPMNHATVSPDGQTLVAVGDFNQAYFFQRQIQETPPQIHKPHNRLNSDSIEWTLTSVVNLHVTEPGASTGYFTTAWSPNGQLVAVGSEGGYITVFDIDLLSNSEISDEDSIVAIVPGSRPDHINPHPGAVRSMMFSPEPWDLLIWAEDQGRICIGDIRTGLKSRQVVNLDPKDENLKRINVEDIPGEEAVAFGNASREFDELEADIIRRYRQAPDNATAVNFATEYIEARRRQRQQRQDRHDRVGLLSQIQSASARERLLSAEDDPQGLTRGEQQILETLRISRQREEARAQGGPARSVNYTTPDMFRDPSSNQSNSPTPNTNTGESSARPISEILSSVQDSFPELARTNAASSPRPGSSHGTGGQNTLAPLSDGVWGPGQRGSTGLVRLSDGSRLPRRRTSIILTPPSSNPSSTPVTGNANNGDSLTTNRAQPSTAEEEDNPWRTIVEEHMTLARGPLFESAQRARAASPLPASVRPTEAELRAEERADRAAERAADRARASSLARQRERWRMLNTERQGAANSPGPSGATDASRLATFAQGGEILLRRTQARGGYSGREIGVRTAGVAMSTDGRTLWAACEEGIFEITIRVKGRLFWPSVEPR